MAGGAEAGKGGGVVSASPYQIVRCLKSDIGLCWASVSYAQTIAAGSRLNPWAEPDMADNYAQAAEMLWEQLARKAVVL